jgi:hypothetical protein
MMLNCIIRFINCYSCKGSFISGAKLILRKLNSLHNFKFDLYILQFIKKENPTCGGVGFLFVLYEWIVNLHYQFIQASY